MTRWWKALAGVLLIAAGTAGAAAAEPAMFRGNARLTGVYPTAPAHSLDGVAFTVATGGPIRSTPAVAGGMLYFGSDDGFLYAVDARNGAQRWRFRSGGSVRSSPAVADGLVFFSSRDGNLYAVGAADGRRRWTMKFAADLGADNYWDYYLSSPIVADGILYVGGGDGRLYALQPRTGRRIWTHDAGARIRSTPAAADGSVVFGTNKGHLVALDTGDGSRRWIFATRGASRTFADKNNDTTSIYASPSIADGIVTVGSRDGYLYAVDLATGEKRWDSTQDGSSWILSTGIDGGTVFVGGGSALIVQALDLRTGAEKWRFPLSGAAFSSMSIAGPMLYFSDLSGMVHALDKASGVERWRFPLGGRSFSTPIVSDGTVYASSDAGILHALRGSTRPAAARPIRRAVFRHGPKDGDFSWFSNQVDVAILEYFKRFGYEQADAARLEQLMREKIANPGAIAIVLADSRLPRALTEQGRADSLVRRYLESGGKLAVPGINPLALHHDPATGQVDRLNFDHARQVLDVDFPPISLGNGFYQSEPTDEGRRWGLRSGFVGFGAVRPGPGIVMLARDEFGMASAWAKNYGGPEGTGLLQLNAPRNEAGDLSQLLAAVEHGLR